MGEIEETVVAGRKVVAPAQHFEARSLEALAPGVRSVDVMVVRDTVEPALIGAAEPAQPQAPGQGGEKQVLAEVLTGEGGGQEAAGPKHPGCLGHRRVHVRNVLHCRVAEHGGEGGVPQGQCRGAGDEEGAVTPPASRLRHHAPVWVHSHVHRLGEEGGGEVAVAAADVQQGALEGDLRKQEALRRTDEDPVYSLSN